MNLEIRRADNEDAAYIINSHRRSIREVCFKDYSPGQIAAWSGRDFREEHWHQTIGRDFVWVISDEERMVYGFGHLQLKDGKQAVLAGLYFAPEALGQAFGKKLVALMFDECRQQWKDKVFLTATKTAKTFYETMGFRQIGENSIIQMGDQTLECYKMEAILK